MGNLPEADSLECLTLNLTVAAGLREDNQSILLHLQTYHHIPRQVENDKQLKEVIDSQLPRSFRERRSLRLGSRTLAQYMVCGQTAQNLALVPAA